MSVWKDCTMTLVYYDERTSDEGDLCDVKIDRENITVSYKEDNTFVIYKGHDMGGGHFHLHCKEKNGETILHLPEGGDILEGYWKEDNDLGFWRIHLN